MKKREYTAMSALEDKHFWFLGKRFFVKVVLDKYLKKGAKILDIGAGTGGMTQFLSNFGNITGIEKDPLAVQLAKKRGIKIFKSDAGKLKFNSASFDLVTIFDVLYHKNIKSETQVLKETYRVLKPKGFLLVTDSAFEFLTSQHDVATQGARRYTLSQMEALIKKSGFKIVYSSYIFMSLFPLLVVKRVILGKLSKGSDSDVASVPVILNLILITILRAEAWVFSHVRLPVGSSVLVFARKK